MKHHSKIDIRKCSCLTKQKQAFRSSKSGIIQYMNDVFSSDHRPRHFTSARDFDDYTTISKVSKFKVSQQSFSQKKEEIVYQRVSVVEK